MFGGDDRVGCGYYLSNDFYPLCAERLDHMANRGGNLSDGGGDLDRFAVCSTPAWTFERRSNPFVDVAARPQGAGDVHATCVLRHRGAHALVWLRILAFRLVQRLAF